MKLLRFEIKKNDCCVNNTPRFFSMTKQAFIDMCINELGRKGESVYTKEDYICDEDGVVSEIKDITKNELFNRCLKYYNSTLSDYDYCRVISEKIKWAKEVNNNLKIKKW